MASSLSANQKVAVVTGSSSGIGFETSLTLARNGFLTYATMRNLKKSANIKSLTEKEKLPLKVERLDIFDSRNSSKMRYDRSPPGSNKIDVLVNDAGYGLTGWVVGRHRNGRGWRGHIRHQSVWCYKSNSEMSLPFMRKQKSGIIGDISSGVVPMGGFPGGIRLC